MTVRELIEHLQQEHPEVDLEEEIKKFIEEYGYERCEDKLLIAIVARHFYGLGQSTKYQQDRAEFAKIKAREWINGYDEGYAKGLNARKEE